MKITTYPDAQPVFVVGCVRSGTSAVVTALRECAGYRGHSEGGISSLLFKLHQVVDKHYGDLPPTYRNSREHMISEIPADSLKDMISGVMGALIHSVMGDGRWLDKTPSGSDMVRSCPMLLQIFPRAKFIFCKRRAIENILSRQRKFPDAPFAGSCHHWADTMHSWMQIRSRLQGHFIELDQRDMAVNSVKAAKAIGNLLELDAEEINAIADAFQTKRVEQTRAATDSNYISLDETGWNEEQKQQFKTICLPMMKAYGYPLVGGGGDNTAPVKLFYPLETSKDTIERHNVAEKGFSAIDSDILQLHPNPPGAGAAVIRYLNIPLNGHSRFVAQLMLGSEESQPVVYGIKIEQAQGRDVVAEVRQVVTAAKPVLWEVDLPILRGMYNVVISTEMAANATSSHYAWARWKNAQLQ